MTARPQRFRLGSMRHSVSIMTPTETLDDAGQPVVTWTSFLANEPAEWIPTGGIEVMRGRQLELGTKGIFRVRYRQGYTTQMKVVHDGTSYGITYINNVEGQKRYLELMVAT